MERALALARRAQGSTSPNPPVGALLVHDERVVGEGFTRPPGQAHAEIVALEAAGERARGAELYVTLEPCSHWGRTPPCTEALIKAGIASAHIAVLDPNPRVSGEGVRQLEEQGIAVSLGECAVEAAELVEAHAKYSKEGRPLVTLLMDAPDEVARQVRAAADLVVRQAPPESDLSAWLDRLGQEEVTSAVIDDPATADLLLRAGLADRIIAAQHVALPKGFFLRTTVEHPVRHALLYPASRTD